MAQVVPDDDLPTFKPVPLDDLPGSAPAKPGNRSFLGAAAESGGRSLLAAGARLVDSLNPFTTSEEEAAVLFKDDPEGLKKFQEKSAAAVLSRFAQEQTKRAREVMGGVDQRERGAVSGKPLGELEYATLDPDKAAYLSPTRVAGDVLQSLPSSLALMVAGYMTRGRALTAASEAEAAALARGMSAQEAKAAAQSAAIAQGAETMAKTSAIGEGSIGYAQQRNQTLDQALQTKPEVYEQSPLYQQLINEEGYTPETARALLAAKAGRESGIIAGAVDAGVNLVGGRALGKIIGEGGKLLPRVGRGALTESGTEVLQSAGEQLGENLSVKTNINPAQSLSEGVGEAAVAGGVVGGVTGGAFAGLLGSARRDSVAAPAPAAGSATDAQLDRSLDQLERARDAVYLGGQPGAETVANVVAAPDLNSAIDAAEASVPSMQQLMEEKRQTAANAARMALGETVASPSFDVNQAVADANARREAAIAQLQEQTGVASSEAPQDRTAEQIVADFEAKRAAAIAELQGSPTAGAVSPVDFEAKRKAAAERAIGEMGDSLPRFRYSPDMQGNKEQAPSTEPDLVGAYVQQMRETNTPAARAFVQLYESGRITPADVSDTIARQNPQNQAPAAPTIPSNTTPMQVEGIQVEQNRARPAPSLDLKNPESAVAERAAAGAATRDATPELTQQRLEAAAAQGQQQAPMEPVQAGQYIAALRLENTPQARALVQEYEAGRVNDQDIADAVNAQRRYQLGGQDLAQARLETAAGQAPGPSTSVQVERSGARTASPALTEAVQMYGSLPLTARDQTVEGASERLTRAAAQAPKTPESLLQVETQPEPRGAFLGRNTAIRQGNEALDQAAAQRGGERMTAPRPTLINGKAPSSYTDQQLQALVQDQSIPAVSRRGAQTELAARQLEQRATAPQAAAAAPGTVSPGGIILASEQRTEATQQGKPVSTLGNITTVDPATLQTNSKADSGTISKQTHRMISLIASMFGKKVVLFSSDNEMAPDGFVRTGDSRTIHLNVKSQVSHLVVFGHELLHQLKADNPQAYAALMKVIKLKEGADTNVAGIRGDMEELTADVVGNRFRETEFWRDVFREILASGTDATVSQRSAMRLGASVVRAVDRMVKALKGMTGFDTDNMVENLAEVKSAVTKALASYAQEKRGEATELIREQVAGRQGSAADTTGEIKTSLRRADFTNPEDRLEVSTTRPVPAPKKGRTSNSYDEKWVVDGQDVRASKNHVNAIVRALREYNTLSGKGNASKLMQELHDVVVENLLWLHDLVPENVRARAKLWYDGANRIATDWTSKYGVSLRQSSGVLAVLSPQMDWFKNVSLGERVISIWKNRQNETWSPAMTAWLQSWVNASKDVNTKASRQAILDEARPLQGVTLSNMNDRQAALYIRVFDETYHERQYRLVTPEGGFGDYVSNSDDGEASVTWGGFDTIEKAVSILNDGSFRNIDEKLGDEHKVRNFYNNIISPGSADGHVTIDTHAVAAALVKALSGSAREVADNFGSAGQNAETGASGTYGLFADAYRAAAEQRGILPREMQSITWEAVRALFPASIKDQLAPQVDAVWDRFKNGELTRDQAREEVRKLAGGVRKMAWEGSDAGKAAADGGTSFNSEISENVAGRQARTLPPEVAKDKVQVNLSANTSSIPGVAALQAAAADGDMLAHRLLQDIALDNLRHLLSGTSARVKADGVTGLYGGYVESGLSMTVTFADEDRAAVLAALAKFADNFNQEQVHVRRGVKAKAGTTFGDGSYATPVYRWELKKPLSRKKIEDVIAQSGLYGLTFGDDFVEAYYVGDPSDEAAITGFEQAIDRAGRLVGRAAESAGRTVERLWAYGDSARGLGYERIQGDVPAGTGLSSETAKRVAGYLNAVKDKDGKPALGKTKTFDNAEITPKQQALQEQIARAYDRLPDNDLKNRNVRKAYTELSKELLRQYQALPIKVEMFTGQGEPYANSAAMRRDVLDNNHLFILATEPGKFGPEGQDFSSHPLLGQTGETDSKGRPMLYNDLLRAVHDYFAHSMSPVSFGPKGEEAAWKNHMAMTDNMWARWALTMETRAQNSWVNFREGLDPTLPLSQRQFAPQKAALLPVQYTLTGDRTVDKPMKEFIAGLNDKVKQGSKPVSGVKASEKRAEDLTPDDLSGRKIRVPVRVEETGETATLTMDAGLALNDINEREAAMQRLLACVSK